MRVQTSVCGVLAVLLPLASAVWRGTGGGSATRDSQTNGVTLPSPNAGLAVERRVALPGNPALPFVPLIAAAGNVIVSSNDTIYFLDTDYNVHSTWTDADGAQLAADPVLDAEADVILAVTEAAEVFGLRASGTAAGTRLWGPTALSEQPTAQGLGFNGSAWFVSAAGSYYKLSSLTGALEHTGSCLLCDAGDVMVSPATVAASSASDVDSVVMVSREGCATLAWLSNGTVRLNAPVVMADGLLISPPAADVRMGQITFSLDSGTICCFTASNGTACRGWPDDLYCMLQPVPASTGHAGVAVSPPSFDFHGGRTYTVTDQGMLLAASTRLGIPADTLAGAVTGPVSANPVLAISGWAANSHALLVVTSGTQSAAAAASTPVRIYAFSVGNNGAVDDDDASDDDGLVTTGLVYSLSLPLTVGTVTASAFAVTDDGKLLIPTSLGSLVVVTSANVPETVGAPWFEGMLIAIISVVSVLGGGMALYFAHRKRQQLFYERLAAEEERNAESALQDASMREASATGLYVAVEDR